MRNRIRQLLLIAVAISIPSWVLAADLPARVPPSAPTYVAPAAFSWTGFYLGGNIGWGWSSGDGTFDGR
jgi:outer membrane immunogenic protein